MRKITIILEINILPTQNDVACGECNIEKRRNFCQRFGEFKNFVEFCRLKCKKSDNEYSKISHSIAAVQC
ncbi:MAG: hypothetical protein II691_08120, partial [Muribaculaceae bacterium]|nr:hypothetical protein [Muribaculaceae bacterium]